VAIKTVMSVFQCAKRWNDGLHKYGMPIRKFENTKVPAP